jgi:integrative and conjugative element protein (TIGR02256 family)
MGEHIFDRIFRWCDQSEMIETGGILVGYYTDTLDSAIVIDASGPPPDSRRGRGWFVRGICGLQQWLHGLWQSGGFYLGEWHFHPSTDPRPSPMDEEQLLKIAMSEKYHCPEPILLIVAINGEGGYQTQLCVFPRGKACIELEPVEPMPLE